jgi:ectoine hydrolase
VKVFEDAEYLSRCKRARERMEARGIDVLLILNEANMSYVSGYRGMTAYVPQMVVLSLDEDQPRIVVRKQDEPCARHTVFMKADRIFSVPEEYITSAEKHSFDYIAGLLRDWGLAARRIGVELDHAPLTPAGWQRLQANLPNAQFVDATSLISWLRIYKSPQEILYMRQAAKIGDLAIQAALDSISAGVRECDVAARVMAAQCAGTSEFPGDRPISPTMPSGELSSCPHLSWRDRRYEEGDTICVELAGFRYRYAGAVSRTVHLGTPPDRLKSIHAATLAGLEEVLAAARPGKTCHELESIFRTTTGRQGWIKNSRIGYSIGIDWTEGTASIAPGDATVLQPSMTFHLMLGMWQDTWGYVLSETFAVTETGAESFSSLPRELFVR